MEMNSQCPFPFSQRDEIKGTWNYFPCGKCYICIRKRISGWSFRLRKHGKKYHTAHFVTLTYEKPPMSKNGFMTLNPRDLQLYFKRLRKSMPIIKTEWKISKTTGKRYRKKIHAKISYYACGEYGGKTNRPHYHIILFGASEELIRAAWSQNGSAIGFVHVGNVSGASIGYTLKYLCKPSKIPMHRNDDRVPEMSRMSHGIGKNYLTPEMIAWHKADLLNRYYVPMEGGQKIGLPRYLKQKVYTEEERKQIATHIKNELKNNDESHCLTEQQYLDLHAQRTKSFFDMSKQRLDGDKI